MAQSSQAPPTPNIISPSPPAADTPETAGDSYFAPVTRSATKQRQVSEEHEGSDYNSDSSLNKRARTRSRSPALSSTSGTRQGQSRKRGMSALTKMNSSTKPTTTTTPTSKSEPLIDEKTPLLPSPNDNGHLSPYSYSTLSSRWREFSRSPSPLGLIPLHRHYRTLIHKHEIPRKALHVSIGFLTLGFYTHGVQTSAITPWLLSALIPIAATDFLRHRFKSVNRVYIRCLGALMRETEVEGYNGVIWYLLGAYISLRFFPKDVGVMGVLLLSWCDTAASTFGRIYGRYTIRLRRGKSLAGTVAAFMTGFVTAAVFWGWWAPRVGVFPDDPPRGLMFRGLLKLPEMLVPAAAGGAVKTTIGGAAAVCIVGVWSGAVAAFSEFVDILGWDDNFTIPVLSSFGLWGFLKVFTP